MRRARRFARQQNRRRAVAEVHRDTGDRARGRVGRGRIGERERNRLSDRRRGGHRPPIVAVGDELTVTVTVADCWLDVVPPVELLTLNRRHFRRCHQPPPVPVLEPSAPAVAVTVAVLLVFSVVCALPRSSVLTTDAVKVPTVVVKVTGTPPSTLPFGSATDAVMTDAPPLCDTVPGLAPTTIRPTAAAPTLNLYRAVRARRRAPRERRDGRDTGVAAGDESHDDLA